MAHIEISEDERQVVLNVIERTLSDLSVEIADTDRMDFRDQLKQRRERLRRVVAKLEAAGESG